MTAAPHECPIPGAALSARLPVIETERLRLRAPELADFDGVQVWLHRAVAPTGVSASVETQGRQKEDVCKTSKRGA